MEMPVRLVLTGEPSILLIFVQLRQIGMEITQPPLPAMRAPSLCQKKDAPFPTA